LNRGRPIPFDLSISARIGRSFVPALQKQLHAAHQAMKSPLLDLSVALVGDKVMSDLHLRFMSIPGPTDVLTFPLDVDAKCRVTSGEIVICVPEARRRAKLYHSTPGKELLLYAVHGMLHLDGWDDQTPTDFEAMHREEDKILRRIGVGAVYDSSRSHR
jgi:probable rRNA maturation factor